MHKLSRDSGATDPILIIAGIAITLILLVGGTFAVSGFINNARDTNAKADLDRVATAQSAAMASSDTYRASAAGPRVMSGKMDTSLADGSIGFVPSDGTTVVVAVGETGWAALAESSSGFSFLRTSMSSATIKVDVSNIREDFLIEALEGRLLDAGSATTVGEQQVVRFPEDVSAYNLAWTWVDAVWGLPADERPEPGASRPDESPGEDEPETGVPPFPTEVPLGDRMGIAFSSDTVDITTMDALSQTRADNVCIYVNFLGRGEAGWSIDIDPSSILFNYDSDASHYTTTSLLKIESVGDRIVLSAKSDTGSMGKLAAGKKYQAQVCNKQVPVLSTSQVDHTISTTHKTGKWEKPVTVSTTSPYFVSWKIRVDFTDVVDEFGMAPGAFRVQGGGSGTIDVTHVDGNVYELAGYGSRTDIKKGQSVSFTIYPAG